jgi:flavin reductase (DIM6/NTAB) family NADH-FMN oxidoreductase RutF
MQDEYKALAADQSHRLINHGPVLLVATKNDTGTYDIAPVAWNCPASKDPPMLLVVVGRSHQTWENIERTGQFIAVVPHHSQKKLVCETGSVSGRDVDKYETMQIESFRGEVVDALVPRGCVGFLECRAQDKLSGPEADAIQASVLRAVVAHRAFDGRLLVETEAGHTLHHLGDKVFATDSDGLVT